MKNLRSIILAVFTAAILLTVSACNEKDSTVDYSSPDAIDYSAPEFTINTYADNSSDDVLEFDMDQEYQMFGHGKHQKKHKRFFLGRILRALDLSDEQKETIHDYLIAHHDCIREWMLALKEAEREILQAANEERREIFEQLRNGDITRAEARELLRQLHQDLKETLDNDPDVQEARENLRDCFVTLFENIEGELTEEQLEKWERWLEFYQELKQRRRR